MNVLEKPKQSQGQQSYFRSVNRDFLNRAGFADQNSTALPQYRAFSPPEPTSDFPGFPEFKSTAEPDKPNCTLHIYCVYAPDDSERTCNDANVPSPSLKSGFINDLVVLYRSGFNVEWETSLPAAAHLKVRGAPDWLLQRMETLRRMPSPNLEEVRTQLKASAEVQGKFDAKPMS